MKMAGLNNKEQFQFDPVGVFYFSLAIYRAHHGSHRTFVGFFSLSLVFCT